MYYDEKFVKSLPDNPYEAIKNICDRHNELYDEIPDDSSEDFDLTVETCALLSKFSELIGMKIYVPEVVGIEEHSIDYANEKIAEVRGEAIKFSTIRQFEDNYGNLLTEKYGKVFHYEFSQGDLGLIQNLINELRDLISTTKELEEDHRHRLIKKLEKVQSELHKRVSDLDRFWGCCVDLSIVVGQMGENAKPMVDLVKKIVDIILPVQNRAYELPSSLPFKLLGQSEDDKSF